MELVPAMLHMRALVHMVMKSVGVWAQILVQKHCISIFCVLSLLVSRNMCCEGVYYTNVAYWSVVTTLYAPHLVTTSHQVHLLVALQ